MLGFVLGPGSTPYAGKGGAPARDGFLRKTHFPWRDRHSAGESLCSGERTPVVSTSLAQGARTPTATPTLLARGRSQLGP